MISEKKVPVLTIDGPSGTGKGTLCHQLAKHLGWHFLDSGALYRVLAYAAVKQAIAFADVQPLVSLAQALNVRFEVDVAEQSRVFLDETEITQDIRTEQCGQNASKIAVIPEIREALLSRQRAFAIFPGLVTDGRDMGTIVFPDADLKIYLYASTEERANRRFLQLKESGNDASLAQVVEELVQRDARDMARSHSPLKPAKDAVLIDTTGQTIVQVFNIVLQLLDLGTI
jgi:cytidylate kinase